MCCHEDGDGRAGVMLPGERNHQIIEWFWWEGTLKTSQFHPCLWARVLGYSPGHGVSSMLGRGSHITTTCAPSPASDLHEPMPEPGPTELQCLEAALHQTSRSVQVSPDWLQEEPVLTYRTCGMPKFLLGAPDQAPCSPSPQFAAEPPPGVLGEQQQEGRSELRDGGSCGVGQCPHAAVRAP